MVVVVRATAVCAPLSVSFPLKILTGRPKMRSEGPSSRASVEEGVEKREEGERGGKAGERPRRRGKETLRETVVDRSRKMREEERNLDGEGRRKDGASQETRRKYVTAGNAAATESFNGREKDLIMDEDGGIKPLTIALHR